MNWKSLALAQGMGALLFWTLAGCGGSSEQQGAPETGVAQQSPPAEGGEAMDEHEEAGHQDEHGDHEHEHGEEADEGLSKLSDADQALAESQKVCPVSGEELTSMGVPVKVTVKDETFFLCCKVCKKKLDADPDKYLAELAKIRAGEAAEAVP